MTCWITEAPGPHYKWDALDIIGPDWDLLIAHPPCTYLTNAGVRHLHSVPSSKGRLPVEHGYDRWMLMLDAARFFRALLDAPVPMVAVENPIPHRYAREIMGDYSQIIQPWQYGHGETKATCLWLRGGLPALKPTKIVKGRHGRVHRMAPGVNRWKDRSRTLPGIADAMAEQWGWL